MGFDHLLEGLFRRQGGHHGGHHGGHYKDSHDGYRDYEDKQYQQPARTGSQNEERQICLQCSAEVQPGSKFCPGCGTPIKLALRCEGCGESLPSGSSFCPQCGRKVKI